MLTSPAHEGGAVYDLIIIGGGCAGLSLATAICRHATKQHLVPKILIIEPRSHYVADRSWCFWEHDAIVDKTLVAKSWSTWVYSCGEKRQLHASKEGWNYHYVPSIKFYAHAENIIAQHQNVTLRRSDNVIDVIPDTNQIEVVTANGSFQTRLLVDTRIPQSVDLNTATLKQVFYGLEVEFENHLNQVDAALIMDQMRTDELGFIFNYVLPLGPKSGLFEITRFANDLLAPGSLRGAAFELVDRYGRQNKFKVLREESGVIPMGLPKPPESHDPRWIYAGIGAGSARASTGYTFQRIQRWAAGCASSFIKGDGLTKPEVDPAYMSWMDNTFLRTIQHRPELAPDLFFALASGVTPDQLLRFLTDRPSYSDLMAIIASLPKRPLIRSALENTFSRTVSSRRDNKWHQA